MNFTLCKNRCNYTKKNKRSRNPTLSAQPFQNRTIPRPAPSPLPYERPRALRPCKALGRSTSGIHARPLSKVRCCRPKKFGRLPKGLPPVAPNTAIPTTLLKAHHAFRHTNPFQNRTITIAFRRGVSLLLPLRRILLLPQPS